MMHADVHVHLRAKAVAKAEWPDVDAVLRALEGLESDSPGGKYKVDPKNHHTWKPVYLGKIRPDGQVEVVWKSKGWVHPEPGSSGTDPSREGDWGSGGKGTYAVGQGRDVRLAER